MAVTTVKLAPGAYKAFEGDGLKIKPVRFDLGVYATSGVAVTAGICGMEVIFGIIFQIPHTTNIKYVKFDVANMKILAYSDVGATEVANTTNLTGQTIPALVIGR